MYSVEYVSEKKEHQLEIDKSSQPVRQPLLAGTSYYQR